MSGDLLFAALLLYYSVCRILFDFLSAELFRNSCKPSLDVFVNELHQLTSLVYHLLSSLLLIKGCCLIHLWMWKEYWSCIAGRQSLVEEHCCHSGGISCNSHRPVYWSLSVYRSYTSCRPFPRRFVESPSISHTGQDLSQDIHRNNKL